MTLCLYFFVLGTIFLHFVTLTLSLLLREVGRERSYSQVRLKRISFIRIRASVGATMGPEVGEHWKGTEAYVRDVSGDLKGGRDICLKP